MIKAIVLLAFLMACTMAFFVVVMAALSFFIVRKLKPIFHAYAKNEMHRHYFGRDMPEYHPEPQQSAPKAKARRRRPMQGHEIVM